MSEPPTQKSATTDDDGYQVRLDSFEGPLDLLLHLVRANEVEITDIPIVEITQQYNDHLDLMRELNLEIAGEYVVMAATLMHIKSRMLLPPDPTEEGEAQEDPRAELTQQLLEYQRFKQAAENLQAIDSLRGLVWTREGKIAEEFAGEELLKVEIFDLVSAFQKLLGRLGDEARLRLKRDDVSVADKIAWLTDILEQQTSISLSELIEPLETRLDRIATFLAILEMMRLRMIVAFQRKLMGEIRVALREDAPDSDSPEEESP